MKIAIITSGCLPGLDGVTIVVRERCRRLSAWGHQVLLIGPDYQPVAKYFPDWQKYVGEIEPGVVCVSVPCGAFFGVEWERNPYPSSHPALERHLDAFRPDVIHVDEPERLAFGYLRRPGLSYARRHGIPALAFYHTNFIDYAPDFLGILPHPVVRAVQHAAKPALSWVYNAYAATFVSSAVTADRLARQGFRNLVAGVFNGVDTRAFAPRERDPGFFANTYGLRNVDDRVKLLFVGRLTPDKGWAFTNRVIPALANAVGCERLAVIIAGGGELEDQIRAELGAHLDSVHLLGRVAPGNMAALYGHSDVHVSSSRKETLGLTAIEAFASGIPVVAPRAGGFLDTVRHGENGFLFQPEDIQDFIRLMQPLIESADLRRRIGARAVEGVLGFDWDRTIGNWFRELDACVAKAAR